MTLSIIIPCYNEEKVINTTLRRITAVLQSMKQDYEIICVNDGSSDRTLEILRNESQKNPYLKILSFSRNFGHQPAVTAGIKECIGDYCLIIDADLQDPPELLPAMLEQMIEQKCNVVYGVRTERKGESIFKKITAKIFYKIIDKLSEVKLPLDTGDFRLIDRKVIDAFNNLPESHKYIRGLIAWLGFNQKPFYYVREERFAGETHYPLFKMISFALRGLLYFSNKPLRLATSLGFICTAVALVLISYVLFATYYLSEDIVSGWPSILITVVFFGGIQLVTVGILGEYIGNIFDEVKKRPEYLIAEKINFKN